MSRSPEGSGQSWLRWYLATHQSPGYNGTWLHSRDKGDLQSSKRQNRDIYDGRRFVNYGRSKRGHTKRGGRRLFTSSTGWKPTTPIIPTPPNASNTAAANTTLHGLRVFLIPGFDCWGRITGKEEERCVLLGSKVMIK